jgi:hypothetical protein
VNESAGNVKAETQEPENQQNNENCPKHFSISFARSSVAKTRKPRYLVVLAGAKNLPHSRQDVLDRGVINPQNGHIRCVATARSARVMDAVSLETDALKALSRL